MELPVEFVSPEFVIPVEFVESTVVVSVEFVVPEFVVSAEFVVSFVEDMLLVIACTLFDDVPVVVLATELSEFEGD